MYLCCVKSTELIPQRIKAIGEGVVFGYADLLLPDDMQTAATMTLSRMVAEGSLRKVGKGKFYKPVVSRLGEMPPMIEQLTKDLLFKDGERIGYITGVPAFSQMGLTTQISSKILIGTRTYRRPLKRGGYEIAYTVQSNEITDTSIPLIRILDALKNNKKIPATSPDAVATIIREQLKKLSDDERTLLISYAINYAPAVRALSGMILENIGCFNAQLKATLNPFTRYSIGISDNLFPNKSNWNIE